MIWKKYWWTCAAALILLCSVAALTLHPGPALTAFGDISQLLLILGCTILMSANAVSGRGQARIFWGLMAAGCSLWTASAALWTYYEVLLRQDVPDPFVGDVILFIHIVPFMAAVALRPHRPQEGQKLYFSTLNFVMLLLWWMFLYAFLVFPEQYVVTHIAVYSRNYDLLYMLENLVLLCALGVLAAGVHGAWKKIYWNFFLAAVVYTWSSETINAAISRGRYYTGSLYDVPFVACVCWLIWAALLARKMPPAYDPVTPRRNRLLAMTPRLAMLAILSLPVMSFWTVFADPAPEPVRHFRLMVTLVAVLVLGLFVFLRQYLLDRELVRLLRQSHNSLENLRRLQTQLVQKEKLASLGQLVAGAAHEINYPLAEILGLSERLAGHSGLDSSQVSLATKIGQQARRTCELVSGLLSFAQQAPAEKALVDIGALLQRSVQMELLRLETRKIHVEISIASGLPRIWGNTNQLFQCCLEIIGNAMDALDEVGGGIFRVTARAENNEVVLEFADSGPGIRQPERVFDPFYTTKAVGKGTGLGLSATYGVVQDHRGQIACHNQPEGGAVFVLRFPIAAQSVGLQPAMATA